MQSECPEVGNAPRVALLLVKCLAAHSEGKTIFPANFPGIPIV